MTYRNLAELHGVQADRLGSRPALRHKRHGLYHDITWERYRADALACAAGLIDMGIQPGDRVGLLAENRPEWLIADMGILAAAAVNVPPHVPLTARQIHFQLADAEVCWLLVSTRKQLEKVRQVRAGLPALRGVVIFDRDGQAEDAISWESFLQHGRRVLPQFTGELAQREAGLGQENLATIMYTSGTTGNPKGVMLTHGNLLSNTLAMLEVFPMGPDTVVLGWLPYSHIYARTVDHYLSLAAGNVLCLADSAETVVQDLEDIEPTSLNAVPRFYEKVLTAAATSSPEETARKLREVFGPRITWLGSGGAPLPPPVAEAYHAAGLPVLQGYGLTESSPVITFNQQSCFKIATVGRAIPGVEVAIAADGEVLTRGPHVMKGYWKDPQATAEAIRDGWLHTGDLGRLDKDGFLTITGRKKDLMILSSGKKVVPALIEGLLLADPCIDQVVVYGEGRSFVTALIVPHWDNLREALRAAGVTLHTPDEDLARQPAVGSLLQRRIELALAEVASWERVKKFVLLPRAFTVEAEELTVSLKLRRTAILARHRDKLDNLYSQ